MAVVSANKKKFYFFLFAFFI